MSHVSRITIGRLFNLGSYEHIRYEIAVELSPGDSAEQTMLGLERLLEALAPESKQCVSSTSELKREQYLLDEMRAQLKKDSEDEFRRKHGHFVGTPEEYVKRIEESHRASLLKRKQWTERAAKARQLLDNLGGAVVWKDHKLDWEDDYNL